MNSLTHMSSLKTDVGTYSDKLLTHTHTSMRTHMHSHTRAQAMSYLMNVFFRLQAVSNMPRIHQGAKVSMCAGACSLSLDAHTHTHTHGADIYIYTHTHRHHAEHHLTACSVCLCSDGCVGDKIRLVVQQPFKLNDRHQQ